jgi:branched-chain amino acid transport system substrate-binding protein
MAQIKALSVATLLVLIAGDATAEISDRLVKIGVMNDQSGVYSDGNGLGSVEAARMAAENFGEVAPGVRVEVIGADHQNKPDIGAGIARRWVDTEGVDAIVDLPTSSVALAVSEIARVSDKTLLVSAGGTSRLTGDACSPTTVHWTYDTWALAHGTGKAVVETGGTSWFFLTADYVFGHDLEAQTAEVVKADGGTVLGSVRHPLATHDFSSFLQQAKASGAKVVGLANAGADTSNAIQEAREFGLVAGGQQLVGLLTDISVIHSLGLETAQGLRFVEAFYWDLNEGTRTFSRRFAERFRGRMPTQYQAGVYAAVLHYLKAVRASGTDAGAAVVAKMKELPTDDPLFGKGTIRADGRKLHPMYLFEIKSPAESKGSWDYYKLLRTIPAEEAFRPLDQGKCPLVVARKS